MATLHEKTCGFYTRGKFTLSEETDTQAVSDLLACKMSCCWAQGRIPGTNYFELARYSPAHEGAKQFIRLCHIDLVNGVERQSA